MTFARRLRAYFIGLVMGALLVAVIFRERLHVLTDWLPGNRVMLELRSQPLAIDPIALCQLGCLSLDTALVRSAMVEGRVKFGESSTRTDPRVYAIDLRPGDKLVRFHFALEESSTNLHRVETPLTESMCSCD